MITGIVLVMHDGVLASLKVLPAAIISILALAGFLCLAIWRPAVMMRQWQAHRLAIGITGLWFLVGAGSALIQLAQMPPPWQGDGKTLWLSGTVERVDGRSNARLRLWVRVSAQDEAVPAELAGQVARLSVDAGDTNVHDHTEGNDRRGQRLVRAGDRLYLQARLYPSPPPVLFGAPDHARQARAHAVVASGYLIQPPQLVGVTGEWQHRLARYRKNCADTIASGMTAPEGGIAAALLIGDRRHVDAATYDMFRFSGLAHLLAISGLHMGLLCFGVIGFVRGAGALAPHLASRFALHKYAALMGLAAAALYVVLSGASISASRAFLMAVLVILAILTDRLALTLRNVGIAALALLALHPLALFTAGFQMSFSATAALVIWFEQRASRTGGWRMWRWFHALITASIIASLATLPFTAQHFGLVTPWGVLANLVGIPLTGLWIMPAGLTVLLTHLMPVPSFVADACLWVMQVGIHLLVGAAGWFATLPATPVAVPPPGSATLFAGYLMVSTYLVFRPDGRVLHRLHRLTIARVVTGVVTGVVILIGCFWLLRPVPDAVLYARITSQLVMPVQIGADASGPGAIKTLAFATTRRRLSDFLAGNAARVLAIQDVTPARTGWVWHGIHRDGTQIAVALNRGALTSACHHPERVGDRPPVVLSLVPARYPCGGYVRLYSLADVPTGNYLLWLPDQDKKDNRLMLRGSEGQYLRINPVSRP